MRITHRTRISGGSAFMLTERIGADVAERFIHAREERARILAIPSDERTPEDEDALIAHKRTIARIAEQHAPDRRCSSR